MSVDLLGLLDGTALTPAAQAGQVVLAGTALVYAGAVRPLAARADLALVLEMVRADLLVDVRIGRLPGQAPAVLGLERTLDRVRRLPRREGVRALRAGRTPSGWWPDDAESGLSGPQAARMRRHRAELDAALESYLRTTNPWRWVRAGLGPRHDRGDATPQPPVAPALAAVDDTPAATVAPLPAPLKIHVSTTGTRDIDLSTQGLLGTR